MFWVINMKKKIIKSIIITELIIVLVTILYNLIFINAYIPTSSMERTIPSNSRVLGIRTAYMFDNPKRGDVIIFAIEEKNELLIKRIVGMPGDIVEIKNGQVYINLSSTPLEEQYVKGIDFSDFGPYAVPKNSYFVLGDNRNNSDDSRYWQNPYVDIKNIRGKAVLGIYPKLKLIE